MNKKLLWGAVALVAILLVGGYFLFSSNTQTALAGDQPGKSNPFSGEITSKTPAELALTVDALPEGFRIKDQAPRVRSEVSEDGLNLGWKNGYYVSFIKGETIFDATLIEQYISIYPVENISLALTDEQSNENVTYDVLEAEKIGDASRAYKVTQHDGSGEQTAYMIEFTRKNVYMQLTVSGVERNYEILRELAKKAASRV